MSKSELISSSSSTNFIRALKNLERSLSTPIAEPRDLSGVIKDFEMAYELSWKVLKKLLRSDGHETLGAKDVYTRAYQLSYLAEESPWIDMIQDRNRTSDVYDEEEAQRIVERIRTLYFPALQALSAKLISQP